MRPVGSRCGPLLRDDQHVTDQGTRPALAQRVVVGIAVGAALTLLGGLLSLGTGAVAASYSTVEQVLQALEEEGLPCRAYAPDRRARDGEEAGSCALEGTFARVSVWESAEDREEAREERSRTEPGFDVDGPRWSVNVPDRALADRVVEALGGEVQAGTP